MAMTPPGLRRAITLLNEGKRHLNANRIAAAERSFRSAAMACAIPTALNNWAMCRYLQGDWSDTLQILSPLLWGHDLAPYSKALAALAHYGRGDTAAARKLLHAAIRDFDVGLAQPSARSEPSDEAWNEYTILIKQAAAALGDHALVLELYGRWPGQAFALGAFMAGVAAFNLARFEEASEYWRGIGDRDWHPSIQAYVRAAGLAHEGLIPPFPLEYEPDGPKPSRAGDADSVKLIAASGSMRVRYLAYLFESGTDKASQMTDALIAHTGEWGVELGRRLLAADGVPMSLKLGAARALTDLGIFAPGAPIPVVHEGRRTSIVPQQMEFQEDSPELQRLVAEALRLRDSGRSDEAYRLLTDLYGKGVAYPPAMITLANLMRDRGELEPARAVMEVLAEAFPDHPAILFNLAGLWLQLKDVDRARQYAERIRPEGMGPEFERRLRELRVALSELSLMAGLFDPRRIANSYREEQEQKQISTELKLRAALKQIPVQWLNAAAALHRVKEVRLRKERETLVATAVADPLRIRRMLGAEAPEVRAALRYVLEQGGWCKLQVLTRRWGSTDGDGFWWDEGPPASPVGRLRVLGLLFVGRSRIGNKSHKVAVVPVDLRELLSRAEQIF